MKISLSAVVLFSAFLFSCADPAANKPKAQTSVPSNAVDVPAGVPAEKVSDFKTRGTAHAITPELSKVEFTGSKVTGKHDGGFKNFTGVIDLVGNKPETSKVAIDIDTTSVFTDAEGLTKHLLTPDFFAAEQFPLATFISTKIEPDTPKGPGNFIITGDLNLRGVKRTITFPAVITLTPNSVIAKAEFSVNRKDFGIAYAGKADDLIRDDVVLRFELTARKKEPVK
ncbi:MAG TPA: YceI family protein [Pyrinomonadaceae bacterium]|nr:YceI family protein [Pyrinomonadaceae bacterium]